MASTTRPGAQPPQDDWPIPVVEEGVLEPEPSVASPGAAAAGKARAKTAPASGRKGAGKKDTRGKGSRDTGEHGAKGRAEKACKPKEANSKDPVKPSTKMTIAELADAYLAHLASIGKQESTVRSYRGDLRLAIRILGGETKISTLTKTKIKGYFESDAVCLNRKGKPRSPITIAKLRRVFRLALAWAVAEGAVKESPVPQTDDKPKKKVKTKKAE